MLDSGAHSFTNRPVDLTGGFVDNHKVWTIHSVAYDNTIQSGRSALVRYQFHIPPDAKGPITMTAAVEYRHLGRVISTMCWARIIRFIRWLSLHRAAAR
jgi:hypothetical protein